MTPKPQQTPQTEKPKVTDHGPKDPVTEAPPAPAKPLLVVPDEPAEQHGSVGIWSY